MKIRSLEITSFGSFESSPQIQFEPGLNLIVGQNNAGKSLILSALKHNSPSFPHKSLDNFEEVRLTKTEFAVQVEMSGRELETAALRKGGSIKIPVPTDSMNDRSYLEKFFSEQEIALAVIKRPGGAMDLPRQSNTVIEFAGAWEYSHEIFAHDAKIRFMNVVGRNDTIPELVGGAWDRQVFFFAPQRFNVARLPFGRHERLNETASNLPGVLALLIGERAHAFERIVRNMRELFPSVKNVSVTHLQQGSFEIRIWPTDEMLTPELSQSLDVNGTGLSQALAILTAAATTENSVILIDEVNTFLHPGAAKALIRILLSEYGSHQYIVSTHSSEIIGMGLASSIHLVTRDECRSSVRRVELEKLDDIAAMAASIRISPTDVFGYDKVVWVEGQTEELCFGALVSEIAELRDLKVRFIPVVATGDLGGRRKDRELVLGIYSRMTSAISPLLKKPVFSFDREGLTAEDVESLRRRSQYRVMFLPRRNLECFLIDPKAVAKLFLRDHGDVPRACNSSEVEQVFKARAGQARYGAAAKWNGDLQDASWLADVDGARLLSDTFRDISDNRVEYRKTAHSLSLLSILMKENPSQLEDLITFVGEVLSKADVEPAVEFAR